MPKQYEQEAIELCRTLYCKYGGRNYERVEKEMRAAGYEGWSKQLLFTKGTGKNHRFGWIEKYGFDKSQQEYLKTQIQGVTDDVQKLYLSIKSVREQQETKIKSGNPTRDDLFVFRDFCKLEMDARQKLDLEKDSYETFVLIWEKILTWLPEIDAKAAFALAAGDTAERLLDRAKAEYGEEEQSQS